MVWKPFLLMFVGELASVSLSWNFDSGEGGTVADAGGSSTSTDFRARLGAPKLPGWVHTSLKGLDVWLDVWLVCDSVPVRVGPPKKANSTSLGSECEAVSPGGDISISKVGMRLRNIDEKERRGDRTFS